MFIVKNEHQLTKNGEKRSFFFEIFASIAIILVIGLVSYFALFKFGSDDEDYRKYPRPRKLYSPWKLTEIEDSDKKWEAKCVDYPIFDCIRTPQLYENEVKKEEVFVEVEAGSLLASGLRFFWDFVIQKVEELLAGTKSFLDSGTNALRLFVKQKVEELKSGTKSFLYSSMNSLRLFVKRKADEAKAGTKSIFKSSVDFLYCLVKEGFKSMVNAVLSAIKYVFYDSVCELCNRNIEYYSSRRSLLVFDLMNQYGTDNLQEMINRRAVDITVSDSDGLTALHYAVKNLKVDALSVLLKTKKIPVDIKTNNGSGMTALHMLSQRNDYGIFMDSARALLIAKQLLDHGADPNSTMGDDKLTPLYWAASMKNKELVRLLIEKGAIVNAKLNNSDWTVFHYAMCDFDMGVIRILIENGAEVDAVTTENQMPIHIAAQYGHIEALTELISRCGISINRPSPLKSSGNCKFPEMGDCLFGATPLHYAARSGQLKLVEFLIQNQCDYDAIDESGNLPDLCYNNMVAEYIGNYRKWKSGDIKNSDSSNV